MYDGNTSEILEELDEYQNKFNEGFPLMQAYGNAKIVRKQIIECIDKNKKAESYLDSAAQKIFSFVTKS